VKIVDDFPHAVREIEHLWIPLADGTRLAARAWIPGDAERAPVPALIEYIPYGKRDGTRERDEPMHRWFAGHGYAALRIDLRGSGESEGALLDEYLPTELDDGAAAIEWVARQPWCSGAVGMIGKSWGGFNALQIAALRPPALRAVVSVCSTDDRYADDAHYMGGCLLNDNLWWGATFFQLCAQPPDPELVGERWREMWLGRLETCTPHPARWLRHPLRDAYWRHGSVCEDFARIECPVYAVGGWADGYTDAIPRLLAGLEAPCRGLVGPWGHSYPHEGSPGPAIGFLQEARRWWDQWLRGTDTGVLREPAYRAWMQESVPAGFDAEDRPGRWIAESRWPSPRIEPRKLALGRGVLTGPGRAGAPERLEVRSLQTLGQAAGGFFSTGLRDQRPDDAGSLCFDGEPLRERCEILGAPRLRIQVASDQPVAFLVARLCDVAPDGSATRVTYGALNLTHRDAHARFEPLRPGERFEIELALHHAAHAFPAGHRLRLALSTAYWPLIWPSPAPVALSVWTERAELELPVRPPDPDDAELRAFELPEAARGPASGALVSHARAGFTRDGTIALGRHEAVGIDGGDGREIRTWIHPHDPLQARVSMQQWTELRRGSWHVGIETSIDLSCSATHFVLRARVAASEDGKTTFARDFDEQIERRGI
jgi:putative CocE/NonD family hydrolase